MRTSQLTLGLSWIAASVAQTSFTAGGFNGELAANSGVLQSLKPTSDNTFDFSPSDYFSDRNGVGNYHTGDITLRWRQVGQSSWTTLDTAVLRNTNPVNSNPQGSLLHSDFSNVSPDAAGKLSLTRDWVQVGSNLVLKATVSVPSNAPAVELGSFGFPIEFNNIFFNRTATDTEAKCSLIDPYIGLGAGYVQVTRLTGTGPNLVLTPYNQASKFEAYRFLDEFNGPPLYYQSQTFEGFYSWEVLTKAWAENEWNGTQPWNPPTSLILQPGKSVTFGLSFAQAPNVYNIESTVSSAGLPVAVGLPGYVLPRDVIGNLFLNYTSAVKSITVTPSGSLTFKSFTAPNKAYKAYTVTPGSTAFGRSLVNITYSDGRVQTVHYSVVKPSVDTANAFSNFFFENSYFTNTSDPFHRADSIIAYDYEAGAQITQEPRAWIAGVADEAGSIYEGISLKSSVHPLPAEIQKLEQMANSSIWGNLQNSDYSVKRSLFFYEPDAVPGYQYSSSISWGGTWNKDDSYSTWRAYDYVHASSIYYSLYRASRSWPNILTIRSPAWYLNQTYHTIMQSQINTAYAGAGLMGETMWVRVLNDLEAEGFTDEASQMESVMKGRQQAWASQADPFGSEMAWDSTGQEGVYAWSRYFGDQATMNKTLNSIRGYNPTVAHWGWNGNARRYWDFLYGGKLARIERMIHHYGSSLNALPLLDAYKYNSNPSSAAAFYDLRVGYGGNMGPLTNINNDGFAATAFHSFPDTMAWDGYSGDYGPTYNGHVLGSCTYLVDHPDFGWVAMGGNVKSASSQQVVVQPTDTVGRCVYVAAMGLSVSIDSGRISQVTFSPQSNAVSISFAKTDGSPATTTVLTYESTLGKNISLKTKAIKQTLGGYQYSLPGSVSFSL